MCFAQSGVTHAFSVLQRVAEEHAERVREALADRVARRVRHGEEPEEARARRVAHRLEVRVLVGLEDRADRDPLREVLVASSLTTPISDLGVRAHEVAERVGERSAGRPGSP